MQVNGKAIALQLYDKLKLRVGELQKKGVTPHLAVILIGHNPSSESYVSQKQKWAEYIGAKVILHRYNEAVDNEEITKKVKELNSDATVHAILIQRPVPAQIEIEKLVQLIDPQKDIDGFHSDSPYILPLPLAVEQILQYTYEDLCKTRGSITSSSSRDFHSWITSKKIVVIGKGETAGKPVQKYFKKLRIPFQQIDSKTLNADELIASADIVISAVGKEHVIIPEKIKQGVILIGVGLFKGEDGKLHGDYDEETINDIAAYYTPTPGGVGPVNVAMLMENLVTACEKQAPRN